ncbi:MAG TPA: hypothetical protein VIK48_02650 [Candidatus Manganitrophaceae bacterium]
MSRTLYKRYYFVDEAGDPTLFDKKDREIIGTEGCSSYFMTGIAHIEQPILLRKKLHDLPAALLADPYFSGVPSFQPEHGKNSPIFSRGG